jgi:hypothetical protein
MDYYCGRCTGASLLVAGVILLLNHYFDLFSIGLVLGVLLCASGIMLLVKPDCGCGKGCHAPMLVEKKPKRK